jgi:5-formyltetrahydrofolate cyclo-ligase
VGKAELRSTLLAARRARSAAERDLAGARIGSALLAAPEVARARVVAGYVGVGAEPPTLTLLASLRERGATVLLPVLEHDDDLDWAEFAGAGQLAEVGRGLLEPTGPRLGPDAILTAEVVLCPGLAAGRDGLRLGRGGGSYDRVLARLARSPFTQAWTCVLLFDGEMLDAVPAENHDQPVDAAATPAGLVRFSSRRA